MNTDQETSEPRRRHSNLPAKGLTTDRLSMRIPANFEAAHTAAETHGQDHWKVRLLQFVHSPPVEYTMMIMLLFDVMILFVELYLQGLYPSCTIITRDAISCCPSLYDELDAAASAVHNATSQETSTGTDEHHLLRFLETSGHDSVCHAPTVEYTRAEAGCDEHKWHTVHTVEDVLFVFTLTILSAFFVEHIIMIIVLQTAFFKQFFYVLDFVIVSVSLGLEIAFALIHDELLFALTGLLIFARVWRFVRIGHGLIEVTAEFQAKEKEALLDYAQELEQKLLENHIDIPVKSGEVKRIEKSLHPTGHGEISMEEPMQERS